MPGVKIRFINRIIGKACDSAGVECRRSPKVRNVTIPIVDSLDSWRMRTLQEHGARITKRFDVVIYVAEALPDQRGDFGFTAERPGTEP